MIKKLIYNLIKLIGTRRLGNLDIFNAENLPAYDCLTGREYNTSMSGIMYIGLSIVSVCRVNGVWDIGTELPYLISWLWDEYTGKCHTCGTRNCDGRCIPF